MRFIEDLRDSHLGEEIWIIGCGPSLDSFPDDFFLGKTTIALNWSITAFPDSTYWYCPRTEMAAMMRFSRKSIMRKTIFLFPFVGFQDWKITEEESLKILGDCKDEPIFMRWRRLDYREELFTKYLQKMVKCIMQREKCLYLGLTVNHCAIQAAVIMGAKKITLVGCDAKCTKNLGHAQRRGMSYFYVETSGREYSIEEQQGISSSQLMQKSGTRALAKAFLPFGIMIREFFHDTGYSKIM